MEDITNYFVFWRQAKDKCIDSACVEQLFSKLKNCYDDYKSIPVDKFCKLLSDMFADQGVHCPLEQRQGSRILEKLASTTEQKNMKEESFVICLQYWTRKEVSVVKALLVVDVQNDFISGSLSLANCPAKEDGEEVVACVNELIESNKFDVLVYTLDWHPPDHVSFFPNLSKQAVDPSTKIEEVKLFDKVVVTKPVRLEQVMWPVHCVQNTWGAELHKDLKKPDLSKDIVTRKGQSSKLDSYSGFWDNGHHSQTGLFLRLLEKGVTDVYVTGLAYDICVAATAKDAAELGFKTFVIHDACRMVSSEGGVAAKATFEKYGIKELKFSSITCE